MEKDKELLKTIRTKTQVAIGSQKYINSTTGEVEEFLVVEKNIEKDFNFHKIWLQDILHVLDSYGNCKMKILSFLLGEMRNEDNSVSVTHTWVSEMLSISRPTVSLAMKAFEKANVLRKIRYGTYQFNPDLIVKGGANKRQNLLIQYNFPEDADKLKKQEPALIEKNIIDVTPPGPIESQGELFNQEREDQN